MCLRSCTLVTVSILFWSVRLYSDARAWGLDTTAHALAATLAFLALDFDIQDELVSQVREVTECRADDILVSVDAPQVTVWSKSGKCESSAL
jgi:hypothetical protein